ncbi:MAG: RNA-binding S4 domain-containing protein [Gammaproteobacteria bacterium]|nr:RNA-binding S4 domain-containing protein [Gammaproteobacteria bacterium]
MNTFEIDREPVELYKLLKFEGLVGSGGEAKHLVADGRVTVNGELETRKRRKIMTGDEICVDGERYRVERSPVFVSQMEPD